MKYNDLNPLVSVIIPNYNNERFIEQCINSVLTQDYENIEIIIVDDGSTDESWKIISEIKSEEKKIHAMRQANMNASVARNRGIEFAQGDYLFFLDSDDIVYPSAIRKMVAAIKKDNADLVIGSFNFIDDKNNVICENRLEQKVVPDSPITFSSEYPNPSNKLFKKSIVVQNDIAFANVRIGQDLNFFLKFLLSSKKIATVNDVLYGYRQVNGSMSSTYNFKIFDIVNVFDDVRKFSEKLGKVEEYNKYLKIVELRNYNLQMNKQIYFKKTAQKKLVVDYFSYFIKQLDVTDCYQFDKYRKSVNMCKLKVTFPLLYTSKVIGRYLAEKDINRLKCQHKIAS